MRKTILFFLLGILIITQVSAEITGLDASLYDCIPIVQNEFNSTYQNFTFILTPSGDIVTKGQLMNKYGYWYNSTTPYCVNELGIYTVNGCSDISCWSYPINVTPSGFKNLGVFLFVFIAIILLVFLIGFKLENGYIMFFGSTLVLIFGFFIFKYGVDIIKNTQTTQAIAWVIWAIGIYALFLSIQEMLKEWNQ